MNKRLVQLQQQMAAAGIDAALLVHPRDVFYYAGTVRPSTLLVGPRETLLLVRRGLEYARAEATLGHVEGGGSMDDVLAALRAQGKDGGTLGIEFDVVPAQLYQRMQQALVGWQLVDVSALVLAQRTVKDSAELAETERAAAIADAGHAALARILRAGLCELELAAEVERAIRLAGHEGYQPLRHPAARGGGVFLMGGENLAVRGGYGLVVTGAGMSPASPFGPSHRPVRSGDLLVLDIGSTCGGYTADESRTYVVGAATPAQRALYDVALAVEEELLRRLRPGVTVSALYAAAEAVVAGGAPPFFAPGELLLPGFVGHGVGLELDEPPVLWARETSTIAEGMVLAVEVEINAPRSGWMAKVEDTAHVTADGLRLLTHTPRTLFED